VNADVARILGQQEIREKFTTLGADPAPGTPEQFAAVIRTDAQKAGRIIKAAGVRAD
jgi:tripartite-type tricarboxylate transporter receptor subunit TctC